MKFIIDGHVRNLEVIPLVLRHYSNGKVYYFNATKVGLRVGLDETTISLAIRGKIHIEQGKQLYIDACLRAGKEHK